MKELLEEYKGQFECLGYNTGKYISFSVPIQKDYKSYLEKASLSGCM